MNDEILEYANKAIEDMPGAWNIPDEFCKKFAESIIRQCAQLAEDVDGNKRTKREILSFFGIK